MYIFKWKKFYFDFQRHASCFPELKKYLEKYFVQTIFLLQNMHV